MRFEVLTLVIRNIIAFWNIIPCSLVVRNQIIIVTLFRLFVWGLFRQVVSISGYIVGSVTFIFHPWFGEHVTVASGGPIRRFPGICLNEMRKTIKPVSEYPVSQPTFKQPLSIALWANLFIIPKKILCLEDFRLKFIRNYGTHIPHQAELHPTWHTVTITNKPYIFTISNTSSPEMTTISHKCWNAVNTYSRDVWNYAP